VRRRRRRLLLLLLPRALFVGRHRTSLRGGRQLSCFGFGGGMSACALLVPIAHLALEPIVRGERDGHGEGRLQPGERQTAKQPLAHALCGGDVAQRA